MLAGLEIEGPGRDRAYANAFDCGQGADKQVVIIRQFVRDASRVSSHFETALSSDSSESKVSPNNHQTSAKTSTRPS